MFNIRMWVVKFARCDKKSKSIKKIIKNSKKCFNVVAICEKITYNKAGDDYVNKIYGSKLSFI